MKSLTKTNKYVVRAARMAPGTRMMRTALILLVALLAWPMGLFAQGWGQYQEGDWGYDLGDHNSVVLQKYHGSATEVTTPETLGGHPVVEIGGSCFAGNKDMTSIIITNGIVKIGEDAFTGCHSLTNISFPITILEIGNGAFCNCTALTSVTLPERLGKVENNLFNGCTKLEGVTIPNSVTSIGEFAFYECANLESVTIGNGVTTIGESAFRNCTSLKSITLPNSVTEIVNYAFDNSGLTDVNYAGTKAQWNKVKITPIYAFAEISPAPTIHWLCTATFDMQGVGTAPEAQAVYSGNPVSAPTPAPTAQGYTFGGWYANAACTTAYDFTKKLDDNITIYAKWTPLENTITFDTGGKGTTPESQTLWSGGTVTEPEVQFVGEAGYEEGIEGWYTDAGRTQAYDFSTPVDHTMTLYAKWVAAGHATISVTNAEGGTCTLTDVKGRTFADGLIIPGIHTLTVTPNDGYSFSGSYTLTNHNNGISTSITKIYGSATKAYPLDLTTADAATSVTFSTQSILTVTRRADDASVLSKVTWSVVDNQAPTTSYGNGSPIPHASGPYGTVATDFGIRLDVDLGNLSGYAFTATIIDRGKGTTIYKNSYDGTSFLIQPFGSIDIDLYVYQIPAITLQDGADNSTTLAENVGIAAGSITLNGRTLYKDGKWNTLCLPFDVKDGDTSDGISFTGTPLEGATVMFLKTSKTNGSGFDSEAGTLTLNFTATTSIAAGRAYIVKWPKPTDYEGHENIYDISNPAFANVSISSTAPSPSTSYDKNVTFTGCYSPVSLAAGDKSVFFIDGNKFYYPAASMSIDAFRGRFQLVTASTDVSTGDVNGDGVISVTDVTFLVDKILGNVNDNFIIENADINGDGFISVSDVTALVDIILGNDSSTITITIVTNLDDSPVTFGGGGSGPARVSKNLK
ncbi:MAG: leucine-rich repeat protein [Prevotella sp.]|nr:leucine-rich repeat protein [Prevotella sp.]